MIADTIARIKITLDNVKPVVLRRIEVPFDIRLDRLHLATQSAMGWTNSHLYEIRAHDVGWSTPLPDVDGAGDFLDARKARLDDPPCCLYAHRPHPRSAKKCPLR